MEMKEGVVKLLLDAGAGDINGQDELYRTALVHAAISGAEGIVRLLLGVGSADTDGQDTVDIYRGDVCDRTALIHTATKGADGVVRLLMDSGAADIDARDIFSWTALQHAAYNKHEAIEDLLRGGIDRANIYGGVPVPDTVV